MSKPRPSNAFIATLAVLITVVWPVVSVALMAQVTP